MAVIEPSHPSFTLVMRIGMMEWVMEHAYTGLLCHFKVDCEVIDGVKYIEKSVTADISGSFIEATVCLLHYQPESALRIYRAIATALRAKKNPDMEPFLTRIAHILDRLAAQCASPSCSRQQMSDGSPLLGCSKCMSSVYCSRECQKRYSQITLDLHSY